VPTRSTYRASNRLVCRCICIYLKPFTSEHAQMSVSAFVLQLHEVTHRKTGSNIPSFRYELLQNKVAINLLVTQD